MQENSSAVGSLESLHPAPLRASPLLPHSKVSSDAHGHSLDLTAPDVQRRRVVFATQMVADVCDPRLTTGHGAGKLRSAIDGGCSTPIIVAVGQERVDVILSQLVTGADVGLATETSVHTDDMESVASPLCACTASSYWKPGIVVHFSTCIQTSVGQWLKWFCEAWGGGLT